MGCEYYMCLETLHSSEQKLLQQCTYFLKFEANDNLMLCHLHIFVLVSL